MKPPTPETATLAAGLVSALGASACCVLPLAALSLGLGGAWISRIQALEPYSPVFLGVAIAAFLLAFYRLYLRRPACAPDAACASPHTRRRQRVAFWGALVAAKALVFFPVLYAALGR